MAQRHSSNKKAAEISQRHGDTGVTIGDSSTVFTEIFLREIRIGQNRIPQSHWDLGEDQGKENKVEIGLLRQAEGEKLRDTQLQLQGTYIPFDTSNYPDKNSCTNYNKCCWKLFVVK